jgi:hypothetical protein
MKAKSETLSNSLVQAWKKRKDYKGYDKSKGSSFNSWRAIRYTSKGKLMGSPNEWKDYDKFLADVQGEWSVGKVVCRHDKTKPHSKENSFWAIKGFESSQKLIRIEYNGENKTIIEWCDDLELNFQGVRQRYFKGKNLTTKEILFGKERKTRNTKEKSQQFRTARMFGAYRLRDKNKGFYNNITLEYFREIIKAGCVYCGDTDKVGLDRIDNAKGHEINNVVPCCYVCNCARNDNFSFDEFKIIGNAIKQIKKMRNENN